MPYQQYAPEQQINPVLQGLTQALSFSSILKNQANQQAQLKLQQDHEARMQGVEDMRNRMQLLANGAQPISDDGTVPTASPNPSMPVLSSPGMPLQTPTGIAPGTPSQPIGTAGGGTTPLPQKPNIGRVFTAGGIKYAFPTPADQQAQAQKDADAKAQAEAAKDQAKTQAEFAKFKNEADYTRANTPLYTFGKDDAGNAIRVPGTQAATIVDNRNTVTNEGVRQGKTQTFEATQKDLDRKATRANQDAREAAIDRRDAAGPVVKPATPFQLKTIEMAKARKMQAAENKYRLSSLTNRGGKPNAAPLDPDKEATDLETLRQAKQDAQDNYSESLNKFGVDTAPVVFGSGGAPAAQPAVAAPVAAPVAKPVAKAGKKNTAEDYLANFGKVK